MLFYKVRKATKIRNRYNQSPRPTQDITRKVTRTQLNITNNTISQQVTTRQQWTDAKAWKTQDKYNTNDPQKKYRLRTFSKNILLEGFNRFHDANLTLSSDVDQDT